MIITVTLNAAIDKTLAVPNFRLGHRHRAVEQTAMAGGKGVNVARALRALGQPVIATGVAGGPTGTRIVEHLTEEGILNDFVRIREESRTSTAVVDPTNGEQTEINEHGPHVTEGELELFVDKLLYLAKGAAVCVVSGSLPRGVDSDLYGRLIEEMKRLGVVTVLDSEGEPMSIATRKGPDIVSPNELEAEGLVGHEFSDEEDRRTAVGEMVELGAREAIMTMPDGLPSDARAAGAGLVGGLRRRVPRGLRGGALRRSRRGGVPALRRGLRGRVDPAFRRRRGGATRGRAPRSGRAR
jgi:1-phosphofructokinase family hexose kinase